MRRGLLLGPVLAGLIALSACAPVPGGVAATVNGTRITEEFIGNLVAGERERLAATGLQGRALQTQLGDYQRATLGQIILGEILEQEADTRGIGLTQEEADELWETQVTLSGSLEELQARLAELGLSEEQARRQLVQGELITRLQADVRAAIVVTDEDVQALYDSRATQWITRTISHIAVETEDEAQDVLDRLDAGEAFEDLAEELSIDTETGPLGGGLGAQPRGTYPVEFDDAVWTAEIGEVVGPIQTNFGVHVVLVEAETERSLEDVREQLEQEIRGGLFQEQFSGLIAALLAESDVKLDGRYGEWDSLAGEIRDNDPFATSTPPGN